MVRVALLFLAASLGVFSVFGAHNVMSTNNGAGTAITIGEEQQKPQANDNNQQNHDENSAVALTDPKSLNPQDQQNLFYDYHHERVHALANLSSVMVWDTRSETNPFGPLWQHFGNHVYKANAIKDPNLKAEPYIFWGSICFAALEFHKHWKANPEERIPHVLFFRMNENWYVEVSLWIYSRTCSSRISSILTYFIMMMIVITVTLQGRIFRSHSWQDRHVDS